MRDWGRLITAMITPFDSELRVDFERASRLAKRLEEEGTTAIVVSGTTGEAPTLTLHEKRELIRSVKESVSIPVIAGIGTNDTKATIEMGLIAKDAGADGVLVVTPYYNKPTQKGLYLHFKAVAQEVNLPVMLYNVPGRTGVDLDAETVIELSKVPGIVALKEATSNLREVAEILQKARDGFLVYTGEDGMLIPFLAVGGYGVVSVLSHLVAPRMVEIIELFLAGKVAEASKSFLRLLPLIDALFMETNPIPVKCALKIMGLDSGKVRLPLTEASEETERRLRKELEALKIL